MKRMLLHIPAASSLLAILLAFLVCLPAMAADPLDDVDGTEAWGREGEPAYRQPVQPARGQYYSPPAQQYYGQPPQQGYSPAPAMKPAQPAVQPYGYAPAVQQPAYKPQYQPQYQPPVPSYAPALRKPALSPADEYRIEAAFWQKARQQWESSFGEIRKEREEYNRIKAAGFGVMRQTAPAYQGQPAYKPSAPAAFQPSYGTPPQPVKPSFPAAAPFGAGQYVKPPPQYSPPQPVIQPSKPVPPPAAGAYSNAQVDDEGGWMDSESQSLKSSIGGSLNLDNQYMGQPPAGPPKMPQGQTLPAFQPLAPPKPSPYALPPPPAYAPPPKPAPPPSFEDGKAFIEQMKKQKEKTQDDLATQGKGYFSEDGQYVDPELKTEMEQGGEE